MLDCRAPAVVFWASDRQLGQKGAASGPRNVRIADYSSTIEFLRENLFSRSILLGRGSGVEANNSTGILGGGSFSDTRLRPGNDDSRSCKT